MGLRDFANPILERFGYQLQRSDASKLGLNPHRDIARLVGNRAQPIVFDVGANVGATARDFRKHMPRAAIHCFEPSGSAYQELTLRCCSMADVQLNNFALGSEPGSRTFNETEAHYTSSFLDLGQDAPSVVSDRTNVEITTADAYCELQGIDRIDVLKSDTQGFELEVLLGAEQLLRRNRVHLVYMEVLFAEYYRDAPALDALYAHLTQRGFRLVCFYQFHFQNGLAGWSDALFVNPDYEPSPVSGRGE